MYREKWWLKIFAQHNTFFSPSYLCLLFCRDVRRFKDRRKEFEKSSEALEGSLSRNAQAPRGKQHEVDEASNALLNARKTFRSEALDYVLEVRKDECREAHTGFTLIRLLGWNNSLQQQHSGHTFALDDNRPASGLPSSLVVVASGWSVSVLVMKIWKSL